MLTTLLVLSLAVAGQEDPAAAKGLLLDVARSLQSGEEVTDHVVIETASLGVPVRVECDVDLCTGGGGTIRRGEVTASVADDWLSVTNERRKDRYFVAEAERKTFEPLLRVFGAPVALLPHLALRQAEDEDSALAAFQRDWEDEVEVKGLAWRKEGGARLAAVSLVHAGGVEETVLIDPSRHAIVRRTAEQDGVTTAIAHDMKRTGRTAEAPEFDPGDRKLADDLLAVLEISAGEDAPLFKAPLLSGGTFDLAAATRESPVILDFWATWCGPCRAGLKKIQSAVDAAGEDAKYRVFAVNVSERSDGDERRELVGGFWEKSGHTLPVVLDMEDSLRRAYGIAEIPVTLLIDRKGRVRAVHDGGPEHLEEWLAEQAKVAAQD